MKSRFYVKSLYKYGKDSIIVVDREMSSGSLFVVVFDLTLVLITSCRIVVIGFYGKGSGTKPVDTDFGTRWGFLERHL